MATIAKQLDEVLRFLLKKYDSRGGEPVLRDDGVIETSFGLHGDYATKMEILFTLMNRFPNEKIDIDLLLNSLEKTGDIKVRGAASDLSYAIDDPGKKILINKGYAKIERDARRESWPKKNWPYVLLLTGLLTAALKFGGDYLNGCRNTKSPKRQIEQNMQPYDTAMKKIHSPTR